jgi:hypothetical protein
MRGRTLDRVGIEPVRDLGNPPPAEVFGENPLDDRRGSSVDLESVGTLSSRGFAGIGVRAGVGEAATVWRSSAEVSPLGRCLSSHRRPHSDLDAIALARTRWRTCARRWSVSSS